MNERGSVSVLSVAVVVVAGLLLAGVARFGSAVVLQARADTAADAAALAAADALALGNTARDAEAAAAETAGANGARLVTCDCEGTHAEVVVVVGAEGVLGGLAGGVRGRARAEVVPGADLTTAVDP